MTVTRMARWGCRISGGLYPMLCACYSVRRYIFYLRLIINFSIRRFAIECRPQSGRTFRSHASGYFLFRSHCSVRSQPSENSQSCYPDTLLHKTRLDCLHIHRMMQFYYADRTQHPHILNGGQTPARFQFCFKLRFNRSPQGSRLTTRKIPNPTLR
jgi:hypothetical protein